MSDLGEILITLGFDARTMLLKIWLPFNIFSTLLEDKWALVISDRYGMPTILRYDLDWGSLDDSIWSVIVHREFLMYFLIS